MSKEPIPVNVTAMPQLMQKPPAPQPAPTQRVVPIERVLARYGQTHIQLVEAEEEIQRGAQLIQHFQTKIQEIANAAVDKDHEIEKLKTDLASTRERLARYEGEGQKAVEDAAQAVEDAAKDSGLKGNEAASAN